MGRHHRPEDPGHSPAFRDRSALRTTALALAGLTLFVVAMVASYAGAFANPVLHHMSVAVSAPEPLIDGLRAEPGLQITQVADAEVARAQVYQRRVDAAFAVTPEGGLSIYVAGGGGRSVAAAAEKIGRTTAGQAGLPAVVEDVAPTSSADPSGTVEFYAVIFISIGASLGAPMEIPVRMFGDRSTEYEAVGTWAVAAANAAWLLLPSGVVALRYRNLAAV